MANSPVTSLVKDLTKPILSRADRTLRLLFGGTAIIIGLMLDIYLSAHFSNFLFGSPHKIPGDLVATVTGVLDKTTPFNWLAWIFFLIGLPGVYLLFRVATRFTRWWRGNSYGVDAMHDYFRKGDAGSSHLHTFWGLIRRRPLPGIPLGRTVWGRPVHVPYDQLSIVVGGPGTGKTSSIVIPAMLSAPGALYSVSHHPESIEVTRRPRDKVGRLWVFDPEGMVDDNPVFSWNPLDGVTNEGKAADVASLFMSRFRKTGEVQEAELKEGALTLLTAIILAAGLDGQPLTKIVEWMPNDLHKPLETLRNHHEEHMLSRVEPLLAGRLGPRIIAHAIFVTSCLAGKSIARYLAGTTSKAGDGRTVFNARTFVTSTDTLYVLCSDGGTSAAPLVSLLTRDVLGAALKAANIPPHYRLTQPFFAVFDSAGMIPMDSLPKQFLHAPGRGIGVMMCVHSYAEGDKAYDGKFDMMWTNADMRIYNGGSSDAGFLDKISKEVGVYSFGAGNKALESRYGDKAGKTIITVDELASLPQDRALLLTKGKKPTMLRTISWRQRRGAEELERAMTSTTVKDMNDDDDDHPKHLGQPLITSKRDGERLASSIDLVKRKAGSLIRRG